jgi:flagellar protein FlgJ
LALREVAKQFESIFTKMLMKSMRDANDALASDDDPFNSEQMKFYRGMFDDQLTLNMAKDGGLGLADVIVQQLSAQVGKGRVDSSVKMGEPNNVKFDASAHAQKQPVRTTQDWLTDVSYHSWQANPEKRKVLFDHQTNDFMKSKDLPAAAVAPATTLTVQGAPKVTETKVSTPKAEDIDGNFSGPSDFIKKLWPLAQDAAKKLNVDPKVIVAQAALETGWGKSVIRQTNGDSSFNLFNIKADSRWDGPKVSVKTVEYRNGVAEKESANFRQYENFQKSFDDYVGFLQENPRYNNALKNTDDSARFVHELQKAGYATDPSYASKIQRIYGSDIFNNVDAI